MLRQAGRVRTLPAGARAQNTGPLKKSDHHAGQVLSVQVSSPGGRDASQAGYLNRPLNKRRVSEDAAGIMLLRNCLNSFSKFSNASN